MIDQHFQNGLSSIDMGEGENFGSNVRVGVSLGFVAGFWYKSFLMDVRVFTASA